MTPASDERGAIAVVLALTMTLVAGMAAIVIDGGAIRFERAELQNGADSAALSIAKKCAYDMPVCNIPATIADWHLDQSAGDRAARVVSAAVDRTAHTVRVVGGVEEAGTGRRSLGLTFASVLGHDDTDVTASATARWTPRVRRWFLPVPIARCEFDEATDGGKRFKQHVVLDYGSGGCADVPGNIPAVGEEYGPLRSETHCNPPSGCAVHDVEPHLGEEIAVSIWSPVGGGNHWKLDGFAGFELESFSRNPGQRTPNHGPCHRHTCLSGRFTRTARVDGTPGGFVLGGEVELID